MTTLNITLLDDNSTMPDLVGAAVPFQVLNARLDVIQRPGVTPAQSYMVHTGISFDVPEGHVMKIYPAPEIAKLHLARLAEGVAVVLPGDQREVVLRMVVDNGGKAFEPKQGMVVAYGLLEAVITPVLMGVDQGSPEGDKTVLQTVVPASEINVLASEKVEPAKDTQRTKKAK